MRALPDLLSAWCAVGLTRVAMMGDGSPKQVAVGNQFKGMGKAWRSIFLLRRAFSNGC